VLRDDLGGITLDVYLKNAIQSIAQESRSKHPDYSRLVNMHRVNGPYNDIEDYLFELSTKLVLDAEKHLDKRAVLQHALRLISGEISMSSFKEYLIQHPAWNHSASYSKTGSLVNRAISYYESIHPAPVINRPLIKL
jgi:hypothetical protein